MSASILPDGPDPAFSVFYAAKVTEQQQHIATLAEAGADPSVLRAEKEALRELQSALAKVAAPCAANAAGNSEGGGPAADGLQVFLAAQEALEHATSAALSSHAAFLDAQRGAQEAIVRASGNTAGEDVDELVQLAAESKRARKAVGAVEEKALKPPQQAYCALFEAKVREQEELVSELRCSGDSARVAEEEDVLSDLRARASAARDGKVKAKPVAKRDERTPLELKNEGNVFFKKRAYEEAIRLYTLALEKDPSMHACYSNRAAAFMGLGKARKALADAELCIEVKSDFIKGYLRKGAALVQLRRFDDAIAAFHVGLTVDPANKALALKLAEAEKFLEDAAAKKQQEEEAAAARRRKEEERRKEEAQKKEEEAQKLKEEAQKKKEEEATKAAADAATAASPAASTTPPLGAPAAKQPGTASPTATRETEQSGAAMETESNPAGEEGGSVYTWIGLGVLVCVAATGAWWVRKSRAAV